jgi:sn-glycerol 3-phosphate transport system permease protein
MIRAKRNCFVRIEAYLYLIPSALILILFTYYPFLKNTIESFFLVDSFGRLRRFVGFENYFRLFVNRRFSQALGNTVIYTLVTVPVSIGAGLFLALLARKKRKLSRIYEAVYAIPMAMAMSVAAMIFQLALNPSIGIVNKTLGLTVNWLQDQRSAFSSLMFIQIWLNLGFNFLFMLSAVRGISSEILESADLDGAGNGRRIRSIIIPLVSPTILFLLASGIAHGMIAGGLTLVLTGGGPNGSTETVVSFIYRQAILNQNYNDGYTATVVGYLISFILIMGSFVYERKGVNYD